MVDEPTWLASRAGRARIALIVLALATLGQSRASCATCDFAPAVSYGAGSVPYSVALGDVNGDGKPDLAVANSQSNTVSILLGNGNGTFPPAVDYAAGGAPYSVALGDVNGDGKPDLAVANNGSSNVSILLGNGNGTFGAAVNYGAGSGPYSVAIGDVNGDGKPDLAVANYSSNNVSILQGNGNGTFGAAVNYGVGTNPQSVAIGDVNGDGKPDLAVANPSSDSVSILLGMGDATFAPAVNYGTGSLPVFVAIGDLNGDGKRDLAVANVNSSTVSTLLGNGDGTFATAVSYGTGTNAYPRSVAIGDVNGDGRPDLAVGNSGSSTVSILLGNGDGAFAPAVNCGVGTYPISVAVGDLNGDGKLDLAVAGANEVSILLNTAPEFPFTDDFLTSTTQVKAVHVTELRNAVNTLRARQDLSVFSFANSPLTAGSSQIQATDIVELRTALDAVYDALGAARPAYTDSAITAGVTEMNRVHITQIRNAVRAADWFILTASRSGAGSGTVTSSPAGINCGTACTKFYLPGTVVTLTAAAAADSTFAGWSGACTGTGTCQVTMAANASVTATFNLIPRFTLTVTENGTGTGSVTSSPAGITCGADCQELYPVGTSVTLTASAPSGSYFANWTGACSGNGTTCTVIMNADVAVGATFNLPAPIDVQPRSYFMGVSGGCEGGVLAQQFTVTAPAGVTWTVIWSGADSPSPGSTHVGGVNRTSGTGSGSVIFTVTVATQNPPSGHTCSDYFDFNYGDLFNFFFTDSNGHVTEVDTSVSSIYRYLL